MTNEGHTAHDVAGSRQQRPLLLPSAFRAAGYRRLEAEVGDELARLLLAALGVPQPDVSRVVSG